MSGYQGEPGGPSDPATPGGYCLARCYCRTCPQYVALPDPTQHQPPERTRAVPYAPPKELGT